MVRATSGVRPTTIAEQDCRASSLQASCPQVAGGLQRGCLGEDSLRGRRRRGAGSAAVRVR
eukprot:277668-Pyramimonas_sp.AAC.1